jgi:hypothetical protein
LDIGLNLKKEFSENEITESEQWKILVDNKIVFGLQFSDPQIWEEKIMTATLSSQYS